MITRLPLRALSSPTIPRSVTCLSQRANLFELRQCKKPPLRSRYSTSSPPPPPPPPATEALKPSDLRSQFAPPISPQLTTPPTPKRSLRPYIYATLFFIIGLTAGQYARLIVAPPDLPPADSKEDRLMVEFLHKEAEKLPIVQSLSTDPNWKAHDAYTSIPSEEASHRLTTGPLAGARALGGFQRVFFNEETGEVITVVWFGGVIAGWPGVAHGGVVATILDEAFGRCAVRQFPSQTGVTANLDINFLKPTVTNSFYVIRVIPVKEGFTEKKGWVSGRLETLDGRVCAEAKALYVVPKKLKTNVISGAF